MKNLENPALALQNKDRSMAWTYAGPAELASPRFSGASHICWPQGGCVKRNRRNGKAIRVTSITKVTSEGVGARIQRLREGKGWKQSDLAKRTGFDQSFISHVESGKRMVSLAGLVRIALALDLTPATLLEIPEFQALEQNIVAHRGLTDRDSKFYEKVGRMVYGRFLASVR